MTDGGPLDKLAAALGVEPGYEDIWHTWHPTPPEAMRAVLACMEQDVGDARAIAASLAGAQRTRWQEILPPAIVRRAGAPDQVTLLRLPCARSDAKFALRLSLETGEAQEHEIDLARLPGVEQIEIDGERFIAWSLPLPPAAPGYHRLSIHADSQCLCDVLYVCAPDRCYTPDAIAADSRVWGAAVQLYAVRSERNWGMGDLTDLRVLMEQWGARGADVIALNPLHTLFLDHPEHASPYSPSSRLFLNPLYLDVERIEDFAQSEEARELVGSVQFQATLQALRTTELVDYRGVADAKLRVLALLYSSFQLRHLARNSARARAFRAFQKREGPALRQQALFEALQAHLQREDPSVWGWPAWPARYRDPRGEAVLTFERQHLDRVEFFEYLQWQADRQLQAAGARALELGLGIGVYGDLAVSIDRGGGEAWSNQSLYALQASIGAPPDEFNMSGQNWGLPPINPHRLRAAAYAPFIAMLRRNMHHLGALRIDHVMGLMRLYWIPQGASAAQGAYVRYPMDDLLGILALESQRNRCMVIGEDLGTVPDEVREALQTRGVLSYRLLFFERDDKGFYKAPDEYPAQALVAASTHDLPTLAGFWEGRDVTIRHELGLFPSEEARQEQVVLRAQARAKLLLMLEREQLLPSGATADPQSVPAMTPELSRALHVFLARTPSKVMLVQSEDVFGVVDQINMPATTDKHPNWQRKLPLSLERWPQDDRFVDLCAALRQVRGGSHPRTREQGVKRTAIVPRATYRLQLNRDFTLRSATALVPYLARLGVSHVYCSPYLRARPGSTHGYDIVDHNSINPEIGDEADLERFVATLREHGMGQILDVVPNHMGVMGSDNAWWLDVLENGPASIYADFFDIDWQPLHSTLAGRVLIPVLGDHYGVMLESGDLKLAFDETQGSFSIWYFAHRFPIDPATYPTILERALRLAPTQSLTSVARDELESLSAAFAHLPPQSSTSTTARSERNRDKEAHKRRLASLIRDSESLAQGVAAAVGALNGTPGNAASFDALHALIEQQAYRLAYWRVASDEINYRRFFDINDLAALRMEDEVVFEATHRRVLEWLREGKIDGLRIDHPDGLYDPKQYFWRLQEHYALEVGATEVLRGDNKDWPLYLLAEKITAPHERLPRDWPLYGTTGYDFANLVNGLFVDHRARSKMQRIYRTFTGDTDGWDDVTYQAKRLIMRMALASELNVLTNRLLRLARSDRRTRDFTHNILRNALAEVVACFPVYRTYVAGSVSDSDRRDIEWAVGQARRRSRTADASVFDFVLRVLEARPTDGAPVDMAAEMMRFTAKLQQFTAPVTAKGVEDTAFYRHFPLASLNEVGGGPEQFGISVKAFHTIMQRNAREWPHTMLATSTHDTKRSEDVRLRIDALSEMPGSWRLTLRHWKRLNRRAKREVDGEMAPSSRDEYLLYQTLLGSIPIEPSEAPSARSRPTSSGEEAAGATGPMPRQPSSSRDPAMVETPSQHARAAAQSAALAAAAHTDEVATRDRPAPRTPDGASRPSRPSLDSGATAPEVVSGQQAAWGQAQLDDYRMRIQRYMLKAVREAKVHTSWVNINEPYEKALEDFLATLLGRAHDNPFLNDLIARARPLAQWGMLSSLSQTLIKLTAPGVPDIYRGTETLDLSLVDPDNRRAVDYERLDSWLTQLQEQEESPRALLSRLIDNIEDGRAKLFVAWKLLELRRQHPQLFAQGSYAPVVVSGDQAEHICAYLREHRSQRALIVAPRLFASLPQADRSAPLGAAVWGSTALRVERAARWTELFSGDSITASDEDRIEVARILTHFPIALLYTHPDNG
ncbi:MAG TPA: malto-oligosyltrehalose synthase [Burkholderiales bacterium]|nr:malto-oligosyltrehalose synthase [Burkholderiales bacterium]